MQAFLDSFPNLYDNLEREQANDIISCGEFNIDLLQNLSSPLLHLMSLLYLIPMISNPTRLIVNSVTFIEHICTTLPDDCTSGVLSYDLSDHLPVSIIKRNVFMSPDVSNIPNTVSYRLINRNNMDIMYNLYTWSQDVSWIIPRSRL